MDLENVNKKALIIILVLIILLFINISATLFIVLFLAFLSPFLIGMLKFLKSSRAAKKETLKKYFFNIYWKKNLLFLFIFIISDALLKVVISLDLVGLPIPYFYYNLPNYHWLLFRLAFFIFDIFFWYMIVGLIARKPMEMSAKVIKLNYITLCAVLFALLYHFLPLISKSQIVII